jgi:serine phosphatase RsbU (regulator of sigma subunit)
MKQALQDRSAKALREMNGSSEKIFEEKVKRPEQFLRPAAIPAIFTEGLRLIKTTGPDASECAAKLEEYKKSNLQGLQYASYLQEAIMHDKESFTDLFPSSFIFFKPKQIVSGDFFWFDKDQNKIFVAAGDCTGHGVPGALLTIMGLNIINNVFHTEESVSPALLMQRIDQRLDRMLSRKNGSKIMNDGMDVSIFSLDRTKNILEYCSANNTIYLIRNGSFIELPSEKYFIGSNTKGKEFIPQQVQVQSGDCVYLCTDGFADQFGGENGKKFSRRRLKELLLSVHNEPMEDQKKIIASVFKTWAGGLEQTDDVLLMGMEI